MGKPKLYDCITFFDENFLTNLRFEILNKVIDIFVVCESKYDHMGNPKPINFSLLNKKYKDRVRHIIIEEQFPNSKNGWKNEEYQREKIFDGIEDATLDDYIFFSDSDEIPNPEKLFDFKLKKKFGIFFQKMFTYKMNLFNKYETPWEGTRISKKKDLKSIDWLRHKVLFKNLKYGFWRIDKEKNIEIIDDGGWHFNYLLRPDEISKKFKSLAETSWDNKKYYDEKTIKEKIEKKIDLFNRGHIFEHKEIDESYPDYIKNNLEKYKEWIL